MELIDRSAELDHLALVFVQDGMLRMTTRNMAAITACQQGMTYKHHHMIRERGKNKFTSEAIPCYLLSRNKNNESYNFVAGIGFLEKLSAILAALGVEAEYYEISASGDDTDDVVSPLGSPSLLDTRLPTVIPKREWLALRDWQRDSIRHVVNRRVGRFNVPTGDGKTTLIAKLCQFLSKSRIVVVAKTIVPIQGLYTAALNEGIVGALDTSRKKVGSASTSRVLFTTTGLLPKYQDERFDVLFGDEIHEHAVSGAVSAIMGAKVVRRFGFSGNADKRQDNAHMWMEALYGPLIMDRKYKDSLADGNVVPIFYRAINTSYSGKPVKTTVISERSKRLVWRNNERNAAFASVGHFYLEQGKSVLALAETTEQALAFRKFFKAPLVCGMPDNEKLEYFIREGLVRRNEIEYIISDGVEMLKKFVAGEVKAVIAGPMWHKAVDVPSLEVVLRLDPRASLISNTQIPGRLARKSPGKKYGLLVDARDEFDTSLNNRFLERIGFYARNGWAEKEV